MCNSRQASVTLIQAVCLIPTLIVGLGLFTSEKSKISPVSCSTGSSPMADIDPAGVSSTPTGMESPLTLNARTNVIRVKKKINRYQSHENFLTSCLQDNLIPKGMRLNFGKAALPNSEYLHTMVNQTIHCANKDILNTCRNAYTALIKKETSSLHKLLYDLQQTTSYQQFENILADLRMHNRAPPHILQRKRRKLEKLREEAKASQLKEPKAPPTTKKPRKRRFRRRQHPKDPRQEIIEDNVVNLSSTTLTTAQSRLLSLGEKFCPVPLSLDSRKLSNDVKEGCRRMRLKEYFFDSDYEDAEEEDVPKFYKPSGWMPPAGRDQALDAYCDTLQTRVEAYRPTKPNDNLHQDERQALKELKEKVTCRQIRISRADKGGAIVIQDMKDYIDEAHRQLYNTDHYTRLQADPTRKIAQESNAITQDLLTSELIDSNTHHWAQIDLAKVICHRFYTLPKIHKNTNPPPGRPIVSGIKGPTENLSRLADYWLQPLVKKLPSLIQDSTHMLKIIDTWNHELGPFKPGTRLVTIDVVSLYTNIPLEDLHTALRYFLERNPSLITPPTNTLLKVVDHVLKNNVFKFDSEIFQQTFGTAMGTPLAPAVANIFMSWLEENMLASSPVNVPLSLWKRFIDDVFLLWTSTEEDLNKFVAHINGFHKTIKFTVSSSTTSMPFLDMEISLSQGYLKTDLYCKPTDTHGYLHPRSCHPRHVCRNIPYSQFIRLRRLCSEEETFKKRCEEMSAFFKKRGYKQTDLDKTMERAQQVPRSDALEYRDKANKTQPRPPLIVTNNPANPPLRSWTRELHKTLMDNSQRASKAIPEPALVAERNCHSLRTLLMPTTLPPPPDATPGSFKCGKKKCVLCRVHIREGNTFTSSQTGETFTIRQKLTCDSSNVVYLLYCDICMHSQYVGETETSLKTRFYQHRSNINKNKGTHVTTHFNKTKHTLDNLKCMAIEKVHVVSKAMRLEREDFWRKKLKTTYPHGLNAMDV